MSLSQQWCIIVNLSTCSTREWKNWSLLLEKNSIPYMAYETNSVDQVSTILSKLLDIGHQQFLFAGGDGTIHQCGNLLLQLAGDKSQLLTIGVLPSGSGNDWFRTFGVKSNKLIASLKAGLTVPLHVIKLTWPDGRERFAFNMVGCAFDAAVVDSLLKSTLKIPGSIKYPLGILRTLMKPHRWNGNIRIDGETFSDDWLTIQAGFGKYCGGGMYVLPHAKTDKAAVLLMRAKSIGRLVSSLAKLYNGKIDKQPEATALHFSEIEIVHTHIPIPIEADGEWLGFSPVKISAEYGVMKRLKEVG